ncbi:MAG TPA: GNAT family N-acetyltransferase [Lacipirellulaceae bacterium]|nr:GNAT family N-acetyltransferase [Lacipirellulaceae bacterium]
MQIETLDRRTISEADARAIAELVVSIWPRPGRTVETFTAEMLGQWNNYRGPEVEHPRSFLVRQSGRVIAHASAYPRTIGTTQGDITVLALARVCTDPSIRGKRLGDAVVRAALELVDHGPFPFALFQTTYEVRPFYERFGAITVDNAFISSLAADPNANPFWADVVMRYPAGPGWPLGQIDLRGPGW